MTKETVHPFSRVCLLYHAVFLVTIGCLLTACNNPEPPKAAAAEDWLNLNIKFKANTTKEMREASIYAIEAKIIDTLAVMRKGKYNYFNPTITISKGTFRDSLNYTVEVGHRGNFYGSAALPDSLPPRLNVSVKQTAPFAQLLFGQKSWDKVHLYPRPPNLLKQSNNRSALIVIDMG